MGSCCLGSTQRTLCSHRGPCSGGTRKGTGAFLCRGLLHSSQTLSNLGLMTRLAIVCQGGFGRAHAACPSSCSSDQPASPAHPGPAGPTAAPLLFSYAPSPLCRGECQGQARTWDPLCLQLSPHQHSDDWVGESTSLKEPSQPSVTGVWSHHSRLVFQNQGRE